VADGEREEAGSEDIRRIARCRREILNLRRAGDEVGNSDATVGDVAAVPNGVATARKRLVVTELEEAFECLLRTAGGRAGNEEAVIAANAKALGSGNYNGRGIAIRAENVVFEIGKAETEAVAEAGGERSIDADRNLVGHIVVSDPDGRERVAAEAAEIVVVVTAPAEENEVVPGRVVIDAEVGGTLVIWSSV